MLMNAHACDVNVVERIHCLGSSPLGEKIIVKQDYCTAPNQELLVDSAVCMKKPRNKTDAGTSRNPRPP